MNEEDKRHEVCPIESVPGLYMTDWVGAGSVNENNILEITHILSVMTATELEQYGPDENPDVELRHLDIADKESTDLVQRLTKECDWVDSSLSSTAQNGRGGAVLVHCQQGVSRSAAVIVAFLMQKRGKSFAQAMQEVKRSRSIVNMNASFVQQLRGSEITIRPLTPVKKTDQAASPMSPKTPVIEIGPMGVIDWQETETG